MKHWHFKRQRAGRKTVRQCECMIGCMCHVFIPTILKYGSREGFRMRKQTNGSSSHWSDSARLGFCPGFGPGLLQPVFLDLHIFASTSKLHVTRSVTKSAHPASPSWTLFSQSNHNNFVDSYRGFVHFPTRWWASRSRRTSLQKNDTQAHTETAGEY